MSLMRLLAFIVGALGCLTNQCGPARASEVRVTPELVCAVQDAIRWRDGQWSAERCARLSQAFAATPEPRVTLAVAVLESDLRPGAVAWSSKNVADVGLCAVRCVLDAAGICSNGPARGKTLTELQDPETNIRVAAMILKQKRHRFGRHRYLASYNGNPDGSNGYAENVKALVAAFAGAEVRVRSKRVRELARKIAASLRRERNG